MKKQTFTIMSFDEQNRDALQHVEGYAIKEEVGGARFFVHKVKGGWTVSEVVSGMAVQKAYKAAGVKDAIEKGIAAASFALKNFGQEKFIAAVEKGKERREACERAMALRAAEEEK